MWDVRTGNVFQDVVRDRSKLPYIAFADVTQERNGHALAALADGTLEILKWT